MRNWMMFIAFWLLNFVFVPNIMGQCDDDDPLIADIFSTEIGCRDGVVLLTFSFSEDDDEFDVFYRIGSTVYTLSDIEDGHTVEHFIQVGDQITLIRVEEEYEGEICVTQVNKTIDPNNPEVPNLILSATPPSCDLNNGSIQAQASGTQPPYEFSIDSGPFQSNPIFNNLSTGTYTITVRDDKGCTNTSTQNLSTTDDLSLSITEVINPTCNANNGSISVQANGGQTPYSYSIDGSNFQDNPFFNSLAEGNYIIIVRDNNNCSRSVEQNLSTTDNLSLVIAEVINPTCNASNGSISVQASGGKTPYSYSIDGSNFQDNPLFNSLAEGNYTIIVRDNNNCSRSVEQSLSATDNLNISNAEVTNPTCNANNGSISVQASGGQTPYSYSIDGSNFQEDPLFSGLGAGNYRLVIVDDAGCSVDTMLSFETHPALELSLNNKMDVNCDRANGIIELSAVGGSLPYLFSIDGSRFQEQVLFEGLQAGNYTAEVIDQEGCVDSLAISLSEILPLVMAEDDLGIETKQTESLTIFVLDNDVIEGEVVLQIVREANKGSIEITNMLTLVYQPDEDELGQDSLLYEVCSASCPLSCDTAMVVIDIEPDEGLCDLEVIDQRVVFPEGITPNNDGYNEYLEFKIVDKLGCPTNYARSDISIFNRWGDIVFKEEPYENRWNGIHQNGQALPPGVYYYALRVDREDKEDFVKFGHVTIFK
ncbi:MAG: gliding motility-associated C-terminal domain-containing protein [Bacteroidota bacterium]